MIVQGTNLPIRFSNIPTDISEALDISVSLFMRDTVLKHWQKDDVTIIESDMFCPLTQAETLAFPIGKVIIEFKYVMANGAILPPLRVQTVIAKRSDSISLTGASEQVAYTVDLDMSEIDVETGKIIYKGYSPYIGDNGDWYEYSDSEKKFVDTGIKAAGEVTKENIEKALGYTPQEELVSGTNIKTINGNDILGDGNLTLDTGKIDDVKVNGTSVVTDKVANITVPTKTSQLTNDSEYITSDSVPTKTSDLTNDSNFITKAISDLENYYLKSETYTKTEVNALVDAIPKFDIKVVTELPTEGISDTTIYLVPASKTETQNLYTEYIHTSDGWEILGSQTIDLSGYATEEWVESKKYLTEETQSDWNETDTTKADYVVNKPAIKAGTGGSSISEGNNCVASGSYSHAEGYYATASGNYSSHAEGVYTTASGNQSHAEGDKTTASGQASHAEGVGTLASGYGQHAQGKYNIEDTDETYADIVGNGVFDYDTDSPKRSNAHTVDWEGNAWFQGDVYVGSTSGTNKDEGSVKLAKITDIPYMPDDGEAGDVLTEVAEKTYQMFNDSVTEKINSNNSSESYITTQNSDGSIYGQIYKDISDDSVAKNVITYWIWPSDASYAYYYLSEKVSSSFNISGSSNKYITGEKGWYYLEWSTEYPEDNPCPLMENQSYIPDSSIFNSIVDYSPETLSVTTDDILNQYVTSTTPSWQPLSAENVSYDSTLESHTEGSIGEAIKTINQDIASQDAKKLDKPTGTLSTSDVGKVLKIKSVNDDGTFVCEWADDNDSNVKINGVETTDNNIPIAEAGGEGAKVGVAAFSSAFAIDSTNRVQMNPATTTDVNGRTSTKAITPSVIVPAVDSVLCSTSTSEALDDTKKAAACERLGAYYPEKEWVLKGTIAGTEDDRGNIDDGVTVDLTGCTEIILKGYITTGAATTTIKSDSGTLADWVSKINTRRHFLSKYGNVFGWFTNTWGRYRDSDTTITNYNGSNICGSTILVLVENITTIFFSASANVTDCSIEIYAR